MPRFSANLGFLFADRAAPGADRRGRRGGLPGGRAALALRRSGRRDPGRPRPGGRGDAQPQHAGRRRRRVRPRRAAGPRGRFRGRVRDRALLRGGDRRLGRALRRRPRAGGRGGRGHLRGQSPPGGRQGRPRRHDDPDRARRITATGRATLLSRVEQAAAIIAATERRNVKIMFDAYHVQITQGDLTRRLEAHLPLVGHIQIAAVPDRGKPDSGEVDFGWLCGWLDGSGYAGWVGSRVPAARADRGRPRLAAGLVSLSAGPRRRAACTRGAPGARSADRRG